MQAIANTGRIASCLLALALQAGALMPAGLQAAEAASQGASGSLPQAPATAVYRRLLVKLKPTATDAPLATRTAQLAISDLSQRLQSGVPGQAPVQLLLHKSISAQLHVVLTDRGLSRSEMLQLIGQLQRDPRVEYAEIDQRLQPQFLPDDPLYGSRQWNLQPPSRGNEGGANLPGAWDVARGEVAPGQGVVVAVIDTGLRPHADLAARLLPGYDFVSDADIANDLDGQWDSDPSDPGDWISIRDSESATFSGCALSTSSWHGTMMAGTIAAVMGNNLGLAGIAPGARLLPVRVFGKCGGYLSDVITGVYWAVGLELPSLPDLMRAPPVNPYPARVINLSMAAEGSCSSAFQEAVDRARGKGAVVIAATGNHNGQATDQGLSQPANCQGVIAVTAHTRRGDLASYANASPSTTLSAPGGGPGLQLLANDGDSITSLGNSGLTSPLADSYEQVRGTSIATAHVSGVAALLLGLQPTLSPDQVRTVLTRSARAYPANSYCTMQAICGAGMLDAEAAVRWLQANPAPVAAPDSGKGGNSESGGGGGAAGWPEWLLLLSAALLSGAGRWRGQPGTGPHQAGRQQPARQSSRM
ncbi:S8 family peptidase [Malikia granosa]|uniref:Peptidase n=1 Tax=Malikia granosa TaxID=263067 RepID=A0A2S9K570_9BURK|nr:S8 family peptidase [Malikia granosa]PRD65603.1 peptidase [Malikia granosa]